ncbi:hypothetical protein SUGI_0195400 [Cryptomeria japonica]|uniref:uncharacterized protein LOC131061429 n=1 Tax=Cryptomeria japonica TaxID=3369 RepID=UPI002408AA3D|nr:uncharacterized protein LOC131061429 [Cryptomeria japonica]GLJ12662.1 hypothetical protein SUGI_0195400 [Cryptomeria japonica]
MGCEVPIVPKAMMENILSSEALARAREGGRSFAAKEWINNPYQTMPSQRFPTIKLQSVAFPQSNQTGTSSTMVSPMPLPLSNSVAYSASQAVGGGLGGLPVVKHVENLHCSENSESKGKRRIRNRVNGLVGKKAKTDSSTDLVLSNGDGKPPSGRSRKRLSSAEGTGKTSSKRQNCRGIKEPENETDHKVVTSNENVLKDSALQAGSNSGSNGILGIYGLKTRSIDLSHHILDLSVNDILSEEFYLPKSGQLGNEGKHSTANSSLIKGLSKILQLMPNSIHTEDKKLKVENSSNLELRSQFEEFERGLQYTTQQKENCAMDSSAEPSALKFSSSFDSTFPLAMCPLYPIQDFVSRLGLPSNEPLENLIVKTDRQPDINNDPNSHVSSTGSIPPLKFSASLSGGSKSPLKSGKESKNRSPWLRAGIVKCATASLQAGSGLGLAVKNNANVECEQKETELTDKYARSEKTKRAFMIDLNVESFEQLDESAMVDAPNSSLLPEMTPEKNSSHSLHQKASESRNGEKDARDSSEDPCHSGVDHSIAEDENLQRRNISLKKETNSEKLPALQLETLRSQTSNIQDANNDIAIESKIKTIQSHDKLTHPEKGEEFEEQMQEPRTLNGFQKPCSVDQNTYQMGETSQRVPSDLQPLQLGLDKGLPSSEMPNSPQVEAAARILFDMANSQFHNNGVSLDNSAQEDSCDRLQRESFKSSTTVNRLVNANMVSESNLKVVEEYGDAEIKAPRTEKKRSRVPSSILLSKKNTSKGTEPGTVLNQFQNKTLESALRNKNTKQGLKGIGKHYSTEAEEESDKQSHIKSSRPSKPIRDDVGLKSVLCSANQNRGNLQPKSPTGAKMHISTKSNQNIRTNIGTHKFTLSREQNQRKLVSVGDVKSSRPTPSFTDRKR